MNQTDCRTDTTAKGLFIWTNISTSTTSLLKGQSYNEGKENYLPYSTLIKITQLWLVESSKINPKLYSVGVPIMFPWQRRVLPETLLSESRLQNSTVFSWIKIYCLWIRWWILLDFRQIEENCLLLKLNILSKVCEHIANILHLSQYPRNSIHVQTNTVPTSFPGSLLFTSQGTRLIQLNLKT